MRLLNRTPCFYPLVFLERRGYGALCPKKPRFLSPSCRFGRAGVLSPPYGIAPQDAHRPSNHCGFFGKPGTPFPAVPRENPAPIPLGRHHEVQDILHNTFLNFGGKDSMPTTHQRCATVLDTTFDPSTDRPIGLFA